MKHTVGYKRLLVGFLFLLSPDLAILDFLPDFIGYILILSGLSILADIDERAFDARVLSKRLLVLSLVKFSFSLAIGSLQKTNLLLVTFSLAVIDLILILPFIKQLFNSLDYTATRQGIILPSKKTSEMKVLMLFFFVLKDALSTLPSFISLIDPSETGDYSSDLWHVDFSALFKVLSALAFLIMLALAVFMTVKAFMYFVPLCRNRELVERLYSNYDRSILQIPSKVISKNIKAITPIAIASLIFFPDFYIDFIEVLPTFIAFVLIVIYSVLTAKKMQVSTVSLTVTSSLGAVVSVISFAYRAYWQNKLAENVEYAFSSQSFTVALGIASLVFTSAVLVLLWMTLLKIEKKYLDEGVSSSGVVLSVAGVVLAVFNFIMYTHPEYNASFVFPSVIFAVFYVYIAIERVRGVSSKILSKYKKWDFS